MFLADYFGALYYKILEKWYIIKMANGMLNNRKLSDNLVEIHGDYRENNPFFILMVCLFILTVHFEFIFKRVVLK